MMSRDILSIFALAALCYSGATMAQGASGIEPTEAVTTADQQAPQKLKRKFSFGEVLNKVSNGLTGVLKDVAKVTGGDAPKRKAAGWLAPVSSEPSPDGRCPSSRYLEEQMKCERAKKEAKRAEAATADAAVEQRLYAAINAAASMPVPGIQQRIAKALRMREDQFRVMGPYANVSGQSLERSFRFYTLCGTGDAACGANPDAPVLGLAIHDSLHDTVVAGKYAPTDKLEYCRETGPCVSTERGRGAAWTQRRFGDYQNRWSLIEGTLARIKRLPDSAALLKKCMRKSGKQESYSVVEADAWGHEELRNKHRSSSFVENQCQQDLIIDVEDCTALWYEGPFRFRPRQTIDVSASSGACRYYVLSGMPLD